MDTNRRMFKTSFTDKNNKRIYEGDIILKKEIILKSEFPGRDRIAINGMSHRQSILPDPGKQWEEEGWVKYLIKWETDCLVAERVEVSSNYDYNPSFFEYLNRAFNSTADKCEILESKYGRKII